MRTLLTPYEAGEPCFAESSGNFSVWFGELMHLERHRAKLVLVPRRGFVFVLSLAPTLVHQTPGCCELIHGGDLFPEVHKVARKQEQLGGSMVFAGPIEAEGTFIPFLQSFGCSFSSTGRKCLFTIKPFLSCLSNPENILPLANLTSLSLFCCLQSQQDSSMACLILQQ